MASSMQASLSTLRTALSQLLCPESDGVAQHLRWRDAVLPAPPRFSAHEVGGAWFKIERNGLDISSLLRRISPQAHTTRPTQRHTSDDFELGNVAMPTQLRPRFVLGNKSVSESRSRYLGPLCDAPTQWIEEWRDRSRRGQFIR